MITIAENIGQLSAQLRILEQKYSRESGSVKLLAVSKRHPADSVAAAHKAGIRDFGESYLQEALDKMQQLPSMHANWHFIGPIQTNKTKPIAENFQWVHSVARLKVAQRLNDQRGSALPKLNICVQVNLSDEASKSGVALSEAQALCDAVEALPYLSLRGLMAIPAVEPDFETQRRVFRRLADEFSRLGSRYAQLDTLSMGMSDDFEAAIAEGSTIVRIGTALFGPRS